MPIVACRICGSETNVTHGDQLFEMYVCEDCRKNLLFCPFELAGCGQITFKEPIGLLDHLVGKHQWNDRKAQRYLRDLKEGSDANNAGESSRS